LLFKLSMWEEESCHTQMPGSTSAMLKACTRQKALCCRSIFREVASVISFGGHPEFLICRELRFCSYFRCCRCFGWIFIDHAFLSQKASSCHWPILLKSCGQCLSHRCCGLQGLRPVCGCRFVEGLNFACCSLRRKHCHTLPALFPSQACLPFAGTFKKSMPPVYA